MKHIWIVDDDDSLRWVLDKTFQKAGYKTSSFEDGYHALEALDEFSQSKNNLAKRPDVILSDINMPGLDGLAFLEKVHEVDSSIPVIIMTAHSDLDSAVSSYSTGAFEYLPKPFDLDEAVNFAQKAISHEVINTPNQANKVESNAGSSQKTKIIGESPAMQEVFRIIGRLAKSNISVLINGESGTGKELIAKALHENSPRAKQSFIALNMAAIPQDLIEAELFGHEKGAFTGANSQRKGRFEQANGGTLFLDEIGDMPYSTQTRLLRVLADGEFYRVGGQTPVKVDVRIIAATHQNLEKLVAEKKFREDLFYRLNVIRIKSPALRERAEDIPMLTSHFLTQIAQELEVAPKVLTTDTQNLLNKHQWRGNVRQLQNTCRYITVMAASNEVTINDLPTDILSTPELNIRTDITQSQSSDDTTYPKSNVSNTVESGVTDPEIEKPNTNTNTNKGSTYHSNQSWHDSLAQVVSESIQSGKHNILADIQPVFEKTLIDTVLSYTKGRKGEAAEILGWGRNTLTRKMNELNG